MISHQLNAVVARRLEVSPGLLVLRVVPDGWQLPEFIPGQFAVLGLPDLVPRENGTDADDRDPKGKLIRRAYSVASSSVERRYLEFYVSLVSSGSFTPRLFALAEGDRLWLGPKITGTFTLAQAPADRDIVLVATGTGLSPYMSMLRSGLYKETTRRIAVLLGARHSWDLGYHAELLTMQWLNLGFTYLPVISRPQDELEAWPGATGRVVDLYREDVIGRIWGDSPSPANSTVFVCGNPVMIEEMMAVLGEQGFREHSRRQSGEILVERW